MQNERDGFCKPVAYVLCVTQRLALGTKHCGGITNPVRRQEQSNSAWADHRAVCPS